MAGTNPHFTTADIVVDVEFLKGRKALAEVGLELVANSLAVSGALLASMLVLDKSGSMGQALVDGLASRIGAGCQRLVLAI
ncbi:MAG: hypothetical protein GY811_25995 [Myxococcales bacterium]|nr:hypothetical protein [Myxococcales bacterium]